MEKVIRLTEAQLLKVIENTVERTKQLDKQKKYHLTEDELRGVINHFIEKTKK